MAQFRVIKVQMGEPLRPWPTSDPKESFVSILRVRSKPATPRVHDGLQRHDWLPLQLGQDMQRGKKVDHSFFCFHVADVEKRKRRECCRFRAAVDTFGSQLMPKLHCKTMLLAPKVRREFCFGLLLNGGVIEVEPFRPRTARFQFPEWTIFVPSFSGPRSISAVACLLVFEKYVRKISWLFFTAFSGHRADARRIPFYMDYSREEWE